jgi:hypothetical protein
MFNETGVFYDEAAKALELFGTAIVGVAYAAATGALQPTEGTTKAGSQLMAAKKNAAHAAAAAPGSPHRERLERRRQRSGYQ